MKKRLKYFAVFYLVGFIISINHTGVPEWYYLFPIKVIPLGLMLIGGNAIYYVAEEKLPFLSAFGRSLKYILIMLVLMLLLALLQNILDVNLSPLIGL